MFTGSLEGDLWSLPITHRLPLQHIALPDYLCHLLRLGHVSVCESAQACLQFSTRCAKVNQLPSWVDHEFCFSVLSHRASAAQLQSTVCLHLPGAILINYEAHAQNLPLCWLYDQQTEIWKMLWRCFLQCNINIASGPLQKSVNMPILG